MSLRISPEPDCRQSWRRASAQRADHRFDALFHRAGVERLDDVVVDPERDGFLHLLLVGVVGRHDERHAGGLGMLADLALQRQPVVVLLVSVRNDQMDVGLFELAQRIAARLGLDDILEAQLSQDVLANPSHRLLVVHDEDADITGFGHSTLYLRGAGYSRQALASKLGKKRYHFIKQESRFMPPTSTWGAHSQACRRW